jgi:hypothetical protein
MKQLSKLSVLKNNCRCLVYKNSLHTAGGKKKKERREKKKKRDRNIHEPQHDEIC